MPERLYQLVGENRKTGVCRDIGLPDTHERIRKFKWAHEGCVGERYTFYKIEEVNFA